MEKEDWLIILTASYYCLSLSLSLLKAVHTLASRANHTDAYLDGLRGDTDLHSDTLAGDDRTGVRQRLAHFGGEQPSEVNVLSIWSPCLALPLTTKERERGRSRRRADVEKDTTSARQFLVTPPSVLVNCRSCWRRGKGHTTTTTTFTAVGGSAAVSG